MRTVALGLATILLISLAPPSHAHENGFGHGAVYSGTLGPGEVNDTHLDFMEGPLVGGWVFLLVARVSGSAIDFELSTTSESVGRWTVPPTDMWYTTFTLPRTGAYNLSLANPGTVDATFSVYYDQSCNCAGKFIPAAFPNGFVIFNVNTTKATTLYAQFNEPRGMRVRITAALQSDDRGRWPDDFEPLAVSNAPVYRQTEGAPPVWLHEFRLSIAGPMRVYFFVQGIALNGSANPSPADLIITPFYEELSSPEAAFPLASVLLGAGAVALITGAIFAWRQGRGRTEHSATDSERSTLSRPDDGRGEPRTRTPRESRRRT